MKFHKYETDLQILPETDKEYRIIKTYLISKDINFNVCYSNIKDQSWHGKNFIEVPFMANSDLKDKLQEIKSDDCN